MAAWSTNLFSRYDRPEHDVFISYSRRSGSTLAQLFRTRLESHRLRVFLDVEADYRGPFPDELAQRIAETQYFLVLLTEGCLDSKWVIGEISQAFATKREIIVVRDPSFIPPSGEELSPILHALMLRNHIPYLHNFSDEVMTRVLARVKRPWPGRRPGFALMVGAASVVLPLVFSYPLGTASAPAAVHQISQQVILPVSTNAPDPTIEVPADPASRPEPARTPQTPAIPSTVVQPAKPSRAQGYCYDLLGYDPTDYSKRREQRHFRSRSQCKNDHDVSTEAGFWESTTECKPCMLKP